MFDTVGIGGGSPYNDACFNGAITEVRLWSGALSAAQVSAEYKAGPSVVAAALVPPPAQCHGKFPARCEPFSGKIVSVYATERQESGKMNKALTITPSDAEQLRVMLSECLAEMKRLREIMKQDDIEIAQSQARTWALIDEIKAMRAADERKAA